MPPCPKPNPGGGDDDGNSGNNGGGDHQSGSPSDDVRIDPSGFVYEAVPANRVEGVQASIYYKETKEDMYGDPYEEIGLWNAKEYAQENPLFTDENGMYRWDVPQGLWQVKFEKDGYQTAYSEWLPVPPPQLDVNIAMKQNRQPEIKTARAYEDAVVVEFDKYMMPRSLTTDNISVMQDGHPVQGAIALLDEETDTEGSGETYASKVRFNASEPFTGEEVTLMVNNSVKSYAGIRMQDNYQQTFNIEQEIKQIVCDPEIFVGYGESGAIDVSILPASASAGKTLVIKTSSPMILGVETERVIIGNDGTAEVIARGELPGRAALTFTVDGSDLTATTIVDIEPVVYSITATPTASIPSGTTVEKGTGVMLYCATDDAVIYYTIDGSCPCDDSAALVMFDGTPVVIDHDLTIKAIAKAPGLDDSDIAEFTYTVKPDDALPATYTDPLVRLTPSPVRERLTVTAGGTTIRRVTVSALTGTVIMASGKPGVTLTLDMGTLPAGLYIVTIETDDGACSRKILKI